MSHDQSKHRESPIRRPSGAQQRRIYHQKEGPEARLRPYLATGGGGGGDDRATASGGSPAAPDELLTSSRISLRSSATWMYLEEEVELDRKVVDQKGRLAAVRTEVQKKESGRLVAIGRQWMTASRAKGSQGSKLRYILVILFCAAFL